MLHFIYFSDLKPGTYRIEVSQDGKKLHCGGVKLHVRAADESCFTAVSYLRQALGRRNLDELDEHLSEVFNSSVPSSGLETIFRDISVSDGKPKST